MKRRSGTNFGNKFPGAAFLCSQHLLYIER
nr:MAG TPA: hypothetical protein [Caudoviricetes sp.]